MLVLTRQRGESIRIGENIVVSVIEIRGDKARLAIVAPPQVSVHRQEVWDAIHGLGEVRPAEVEPQVDPAWLAWNDGTVARLARRIRDGQAWDLLPILADALEEAGCDSTSMLRHCRAGAGHEPNCWVVDLLLSGD